MESRKIEVGAGAKIRVYQGGEGPELVFLHGAGGLIPDDPFLAKLALRYHVTAPVLPGYEDSEGEDGLHDMLAVTLHGFDVLDALGIRSPILVGHSMGGMIAAEMAAIAPHEVERLVLIAPAGLWMDAQPIPDLFSLLPMEMPALLFHDPAKGAALLSSGADFSNPEFIKTFLIDNARRLGMAGKLLFPIPDRRLCDRLYRVQAPTLLVWGKGDKLIVPPYGEAFERGLTNAKRLERVEIDEAGHMVPYEQTDAVAGAIEAFAAKSQS